MSKTDAEIDAENTELWYRCRDFITEQSRGEWGEAIIAEDTKKLVSFVLAEIEQAASVYSHLVKTDAG